MSDNYGLTLVINDGTADPREGRGRCFRKFWWCFWAFVIFLMLFSGLDAATADINCIGDSDPRCTDGMVSLIFLCGLPMLLSFLGMIVYGIDGFYMWGKQMKWERRHAAAMNRVREDIARGDQ